MVKLTKVVCEACRVGASLATKNEISEYMPQIPQWEMVEVDSIWRLQRRYVFPDFVLAIDFANEIAKIAEKQNHHPMLLVEWGGVEVSWWTHTIKGLHKNDFAMAAQTDLLYHL